MVGKLKREGNSGFEDVLRKYKAGAKIRKLEWRLENKDFYSLTQEPCVYCGSKKSNSARKSLSPFDYNGVDRVDNNEGYYKENCVACCWLCNRMKGNLSLREFLEKIEDIFYHSTMGF